MVVVLAQHDMYGVAGSGRVSGGDYGLRIMQKQSASEIGFAYSIIWFELSPVRDLPAVIVRFA